MRRRLPRDEGTTRSGAGLWGVSCSTKFVMASVSPDLAGIEVVLRSFPIFPKLFVCLPSPHYKVNEITVMLWHAPVTTPS